MSETGWTTCKAGFRHPPDDVCTHIVALPGAQSQERTPGPQPRYRIPKDHDVVVIADNGRVVKSYAKGGFYSEEAMALRRAENKIKYMPAFQRERLEEQRLREEKAAAKAEGSFMGEA